MALGYDESITLAVESGGPSTVLEFLLCMWMEFVVMIVAGCLYFRLSAYAGKPLSWKQALQSLALARPRCDMAGKESWTSNQEVPELQNASRALRGGDLDKAIVSLGRWAAARAHNVPRLLGARLLLLAVAGEDQDRVQAKLKPLKGRILTESLEVASFETLRQDDIAGCRRLRVLAASLMIQSSQKTLKAFAKAHINDTLALRSLVAESPVPLDRPFAEAVLEACAIQGEEELATEVFRKADGEDFASLHDFFERLTKKGAGQHRVGPQREQIAHSKVIRAHGKNKDLSAALEAFEAFQTKHGSGTPLYNSIIDACVECEDMPRALAYFRQARDGGLADTVSFNILIKGYVGRNNIEAAEACLSELKRSGLTLTAASYNGLVGYRVQSGDGQGAWRIVEEMRASGVHVSLVTCFVLVRKQYITRAELSRIVALLDDSEEPMDEGFFLAFAEACVRTGAMQLLAKKRAEYVARGGRPALPCPVYGAMIKAYGQAHDLKRVRELWCEIESCDVTLTSITFGCMVEALVANGAAMEASQLARSVWEKPAQRSLINTVTYTTIMKGFAHLRQPEEVMALYEEMRARGIRANTVTFNTILNAFAQSSIMHRVPEILNDMQNSDPPIEPDIVTYSTLVKGLCANRDLDAGLGVLEHMTSAGRVAPDDVMYNSLLDGCAKQSRLDDALRLLDDMQRRGVRPSNYTLSMMVKLMGRCKRLDAAFVLIETLSKQHSFKVNLQVYTCLIQSCFHNKQPLKALAVHDQLLAEGLCPDEKLYNSMVGGLLRNGALRQAVRLVRIAYNLPADGFFPLSRSVVPGVSACCLDELIASLGGTGAPEAAALLREVRESQESTVWADSCGVFGRGALTYAH